MTDSENKKKRIMVVDDEVIVAEDIKQRLRGLGYEVTGVAATGEEAINLADETRPDLILMDIMLKGAMDGTEAATVIRERFDIALIFLTAYSDDATLERAKVTGPFGYILKPFDERELKRTIEISLYRQKMERELNEANKKVEVLSGLLPICAECKKIKDDKGYWNKIEAYISQRTSVEFTHGFCPDCVEKFLHKAGLSKKDRK